MKRLKITLQIQAAGETFREKQQTDTKLSLPELCKEKLIKYTN